MESEPWSRNLSLRLPKEQYQVRSALLLFWKRSNEILALHRKYIREPNGLTLLGKVLVLPTYFFWKDGRSHALAEEERKARGRQGPVDQWNRSRLISNCGDPALEVEEIGNASVPN